MKIFCRIRVWLRVSFKWDFQVRVGLCVMELIVSYSGCSSMEFFVDFEAGSGLTSNGIFWFGSCCVSTVNILSGSNQIACSIEFFSRIRIGLRVDCMT